MIDLREPVLKALEEARQAKQIGGGLEAKVILTGGPQVLRDYAAQLPALFVVSQVELDGEPSETLTVKVVEADGEKCERCWKYQTSVGSDDTYPTICDGCADAVKQMYPDGLPSEE